jgi:hypothetical protein
MEAICSRDTSSTHYLFELNTGEHIYQAHDDHLSIYNEDGTSAKLIGMLNPAFIRTYHANMNSYAERGKIWIRKELQEFLRVFNDKNAEFGS